MSIQVCIPLALTAVYNFICIYDPDEIWDFDNNWELPNPGFGNLAMGPENSEEIGKAMVKRDGIAQVMWVAYQDELASHNRNTN